MRINIYYCIVGNVMKDYIVLDLETPNKYANSMSSIGIVVVNDGEVTDEIYSLINPEAHFDDFNIKLTGIHPEDVLNSPTFPEFYDEYEDLLLHNIIVGQNITFDLSVISKSMTRYNMPIPPFEYYCTLKSCKRNLTLPDNSLSYIVSNVLNTTYNAHNAMADAQMTNELYNYLESYENRSNFLNIYYYRPNCKRDFNRTFDYNYNYLYGLLKKFNYVDEISENYSSLLETWYESNKGYDNHPLIQNVLLKVLYIINGQLTQKEIRQIIKSINPIKRSPEYKVKKLKLQVFKGLIDSITCEEELNEEDIKYLKEWINNIKIDEKSFKQITKNLDYEEYDILKEEFIKYSKFLEEYL